MTVFDFLIGKNPKKRDEYLRENKEQAKKLREALSNLPEDVILGLIPQPKKEEGE